MGSPGGPIKVISLNLAQGQGQSQWSMAPVVGRQMPADLLGFQEPDDWLENMRFTNSDTLGWYQSDKKRWPHTNPAPIAWNKNRFDDLGTWNQEVGKDGCGPRVLEMALLKDKSSGNKVFFANTHGPVPGPCKGWGTSGWEYDRNIANAIKSKKGDADIIIIAGDFNKNQWTFKETKQIVSHVVEGSWNIDMIMSNVRCTGGSFEGHPSDHDGVQVTCNI